MKKLQEKLKAIIIDNVIAAVLSFIIMVIMCFIFENEILINLKTLWILILFASVEIFAYNIIVLIKIPNLQKRFNSEFNYLIKKNKK